MAKVIMVQGTMSNAGKSLLVAGLCRVFKQDGYRVAPFKSQNMALNSFITKEGLEMGRAQVVQAEAAGMEPSVNMNPILLKPTNDVGSQVIVNGQVLGNMKAMDYFQYKRKLIPHIIKAFTCLAEQVDIIVIEGAGSPAEINLKENDIVNMGMASMVDAPVLLVGDIDRGGVFAQLLGTLLLLEDEEKDRIKGLIINKFRGDKTILDPGITMLEEKGQIPVVGVVPYMQLKIEDEDSLTEKFGEMTEKLIDLAVVRYPRISNFTDLDVFEQNENISIRYITSPKDIKNADLIVLPGSKNTMGDLKWMRQNGLEAAIKKYAQTGPVVGICGGYQMLGEVIEDPFSMEEGGSLRGMELLPVTTRLEKEKVRTQVTGTFAKITGPLEQLWQESIEGYEIHMGHTVSAIDSPVTWIQETNQIHLGGVDKLDGQIHQDGCFQGNVYGTYVHGVFDGGTCASTLIHILAERKGISDQQLELGNYRGFKEKQYDLLADGIRHSVDMKAVYNMLREVKIEGGIL